MRCLLVLFVLFVPLAGCTYRVETRKTETQPLVVDAGEWQPTPSEQATLFGTHRLPPQMHPEARQIYRWLAMLLVEPDGSFLGFERATFFNGDDQDVELGFRNRRGTYALRRRSDGTRVLVLTFAPATDGAEASRTDLGSVTYFVRFGDDLTLAYDDAGGQTDDAFLPMPRDVAGACAVTSDCTAQHPDDPAASWQCVVPDNTLGPSFGTCAPPELPPPT